MSKVSRMIPSASNVFSPIGRIYQFAKFRQQRNHDLHELRSMSRYIQEDVGLLR